VDFLVGAAVFEDIRSVLCLYISIRIAQDVLIGSTYTNSVDGQELGILVMGYPFFATVRDVND
jgi:hypothetical protein